MLDIRQIRENPQIVQELLKRRGEYDLQPIIELDEKQRQLETERSQLQARSNQVGKQVGEKIKSGSDPKVTEIKALKEEGNKVKAKLSELEPEEKELTAKIEALLLPLPNLPSESTPIGKSEAENIEVKRWGDEYIPQNPKIIPHYEIGEKLGIMDFERGVKIAQSRFVALMGAGAA
ncbi:MAG: serine--tRNA ligase, partial [Trichodesmium sp. St11_bin5]|nr:serine--tRNA ligase [Trichodesmium sp. St11_bin5]